MLTEEQPAVLDPTRVDTAVREVHATKDAWATAPTEERIALLETLRVHTLRVAEAWVAAAVEAKGIPADSPLTGEEWMSGPWALLEGIQTMKGTLEAWRDGADLLQGARVRTRADGQVAVQVHPANHWEKLLLSGVTAEVWMEAGVTSTNLRDHMAELYRTPPSTGHVAVVLGAGNIASIPPLDLLYKFIAEKQVCVMKMNPVNDYLGPFFEDIFQEFVAKGYLRFAYGGIDVGQFLCEHPLVDEIHVTGAERTHDAIVYGVGEEGARRKSADEPKNDRRVTAELGGVSPVIVVPGPWTAADLRFQAENVVSQKMHNSGFNCIASQVMVLSEQWDQRDAFRTAVQQVFSEVPPRTPYYPGARERIEGARGAVDSVTVIDAGAEIPRLLLEPVDANTDHYCFSTEFFAPALAETGLPGADPETFLRNAVRFANEQLHGTLGATILIHPKTEAALGPVFEQLLAKLRYGTIGVNAWSGVNFLLPRSTWGAFPGHPRNDIASGVGVVHNGLLFDKPERTIVRAPFRPSPRSLANGEWTILPRPPWFVTNRQSHEVGRRITTFAAGPSWMQLPGIFAAALRG